MASLGETCTHTAAVLFYLEAFARAEDRKTCTDKSCEWKMPTFQKSIEYAPINNIDFTSAKRKKMLTEASPLKSPQATFQLKPSEHVYVRRPSVEEKSHFLLTLSKAGSKPAVLSLLPPYSEAYIPKESSGKRPCALTSLYWTNFSKLSFPQLLQEGEKVQLCVTEQHVNAGEFETRQQVTCKNMVFAT